MGYLPVCDNSTQLCRGERYVNEGIEHSRQSIWQGVTEGSNMCMIFPVSDMDEMNRNLLMM